MTEFTTRVVIVVTGGQLNAANVKTKAVDSVGGEFTFSLGLSPSGKLPPTHFWCNWQMKPSDFDRLKILLGKIPGHNEQIFLLSDYDPAIAKPTPAEVLGLTTPPLQVINPPGSP